VGQLNRRCSPGGRDVSVAGRVGVHSCPVGRGPELPVPQRVDAEFGRGVRREGSHDDCIESLYLTGAERAVLQDFITGLRDGDFSRLASAFEGERPLVLLWEERGAFVALPDVRAEALTCACFLGQITVAQYLLAHGVDPAAGARTGLNALHWAVNRGQLEAVRLLVRSGVSLETRNMYEGTALGTAVWAAVHESRPAHPQIIEELLQAGAHVADAEYPSGDASIDAILRRYGATAA
jgi:hypothetical protein